MPGVRLEDHMYAARFSAILFAMSMMPNTSAAQQTPAPAPQTYALAAQMVRGYDMLQRDLAEAAEKMPEEQYRFRPTPDVRPFGQLLAHVALAQFRTCAILKGEPNPRKDDKEDASRSKAEEMALLSASSAYCDQPVHALTDATMTEMTKTAQLQVAKGLVPVELVAHGMEMYGVMTVYLRLKGIVPPTTARQNQQMKPKSGR
jgi:hypothetical protein